jgi:hypothetical protein
MAKKKARAGARELTRAELKALERRAASVALPARAAVAEAEAPVEASPAPAARRGVLPPRASRVAIGLPALSRGQEIAFIRSDLQRLTILAGLMLAILVVLAIFLR